MRVQLIHGDTIIGGLQPGGRLNSLINKREPDKQEAVAAALAECGLSLQGTPLQWAKSPHSGVGKAVASANTHHKHNKRFI